MLNNSLILESYYQYQESIDTSAIDYEPQEFKQVQDQLDKALDKLEALLPKDSDAFSDIDEAIGAIIAYESRRCYFAGFTNGANLIMDIKK